LWKTHQQLITACDQQIESMLQKFDPRRAPDAALAPATTSHKKPQKNEPQFLAREECFRVLGVDLTAVPGFQTPTVLVLVCELGPGFAQKFKTAKHFGSWLGLCPDTASPAGKYTARKRAT